MKGDNYIYIGADLVIVQLQREKAGNGNRPIPIRHAIQQARANTSTEGLA